MNWFPNAYTRLSQAGFAGSAAGFTGLSATWQEPQAVPTRYGGSGVASLRYVARSHLAASNLGFGILRKPMIPVERGSTQSSNQRPYASACVAGLQPGSLSAPRCVQ